jgi:integrase
MAGIPDEAIQKFLGHASVRTTQEIYTRLTGGAEKRAADKMDEILGPVAVKKAKSGAD